MRPSNRLAGSIKPRRQTIEIVRPIHIVLDVLLAAPDHLHRTIDVLGDLDGQHRAIGLQPSAEATANQMIVNLIASFGSPVSSATRDCVSVGACVPTQMSQPPFCR